MVAGLAAAVHLEAVGVTAAGHRVIPRFALERVRAEDEGGVDGEALGLGPWAR
jgi:hypothetical protein